MEEEESYRKTKATGVVEGASRGKFAGMEKNPRRPRELVGIAKPKSTRQIGSVAKGVVKHVKIGLDMNQSKSKLLKLEHEITRITDRIADIEFEIHHVSELDLLKKGDFLVERRRAIDKLRHLKDDLYRLKMDNINET